MVRSSFFVLSFFPWRIRASITSSDFIALKAVAQGIVAQLRIFGGSIGIASGFLVFNSNVQHTLSGVLTPEQLDEFYRTPAAISRLPAAQQLAVRQVYVSSFNTDMRICAGISAACLLATLCTYQRNPQSIKQRLADLEEAYSRTEAARAGADGGVGTVLRV